MKRGLSARSRKTWRRRRTKAFSPLGLTIASSHTALRRSSCVTNCPEWLTKWCNTAKSLGGSTMRLAPRHRQASLGSRRNGGKVNVVAGVFIPGVCHLIATKRLQKHYHFRLDGPSRTEIHTSVTIREKEEKAMTH